eukprot:54420_1
MDSIFTNRRLLHARDSHKMKEHTQMAMIIGSILYLELFWLPLLIYKLYGVMKHKHTNEFRKRHPLYLFFLYFMVLFYIAIQEPISLLILYPSDVFFTDSNLNYSALTGGIIHICHFFVCLGFFLLYLARAWMLYHDYRFNDCVANLCWRLEIQPTYKHDNWWISKRSVYGNPRYILVVMIIVWFVLMGIYCILYFVVCHGTHHTFDDKISVIIQWILAVLATVPVALSYAMVVFKIRAITDVFKIKEELSATNRICLLCVLIFFVLLIVCSSTDISMDSAPMVCVASLVSSTAAGVIIYLNIRYIQKSVQDNEDTRKNSMSRSTLREYNIPDMHLEDVLEDRIGFESFMKHLVAEFSVENLLFISEVQQFRSTLNYEATEKERDEEQDLHVPILNLEWLPLSIGLKNDSPWLRAQYIYAKFICKTALHQVNISHRVFSQCTTFFPELSGLNDTNNVAAMPSKGLGRTSQSYNYYYANSMKYSISSQNYHTGAYLHMSDTQRKTLIEEKKKTVTNPTADGTAPKINRRVGNRPFRALSEKYLKKKGKKTRKLHKSPTVSPILEKRIKTSPTVELSQTPSKSIAIRCESLALSGVREDDDTDKDIKEHVENANLVSFKYELYHVFDNAEREVWMLMKDSLTRYQQTSTYEKMAIGKALRKRRKTNFGANDTIVDGNKDNHNRGVTNFWKELKKIGHQRSKPDLTQPLLGP